MLDVQRLRVRLGLSPVDMGRLFGVSLATAYRWDHLDDETKIDPRSRTLLTWAAERIDRKDGPTWAHRVKRTLHMKGELSALVALLDGVEPPWSPPRPLSHMRGPRSAGKPRRSHKRDV